MMKNNIPSLLGSVIIKTDRDLLSLANVLSKNVFAGLPFGGLYDRICEEVPAVFIYDFMGLKIVLQQGKDDGKTFFYGLDVFPVHKIEGKKEYIQINHYLYKLLSLRLAEEHDIEVIEWVPPVD